MISLLRGKIAEKSDRSLTVDVGGVGYSVTVPLSTFSNLPDTGTEVELKIHTHITEKSFELFGFLTDSEKILFQCLIGVSGIGPKAATNILSNITTQDLIRSIMTGDLGSRKVPGVGAKPAARLIDELKDKRASYNLEEDTVAVNGVIGDVKSVLLNLGFTKNEIEENADQLNEILNKSMSIEEKVRESLKIMKKR